MNWEHTAMVIVTVVITYGGIKLIDRWFNHTDRKHKKTLF